MRRAQRNASALGQPTSLPLVRAERAGAVMFLCG